MQTDFDDNDMKKCLKRDLKDFRESLEQRIELLHKKERRFTPHLDIEWVQINAQIKGYAEILDFFNDVFIKPKRSIMTISKMIALLQMELKEHGDLKISVEGDRWLREDECYVNLNGGEPDFVIHD